MQDQKKLDLLPNFLFSLALAHFMMAKGDEEEEHLAEAEGFLRHGLSRFPFLLGQILDRLSIQPDAKVDNHYYLGETAFSRLALCLGNRYITQRSSERRTE